MTRRITRGSVYPEQENIPSQRVPDRIPYAPSLGDLQRSSELQPPHPAAPPPPGNQYVVSTYDARPINAVDFQTQSGTNADDTGFDPDAGPYFTSSIFYDVPEGRVAVVRDFHILMVPQQGEPAGETPCGILCPNGASNFRITFTMFVNGVAQEGMSNIVSWGIPFGDVFGECYFLAGPNDRIEFRVTGNAAGPGSAWFQALLSLHGNLLKQQGNEIQYEPGSQRAVAVTQAEGR